MSHLVREDGTHFVIPSYRDVLSSKRTSSLKKDILLLSQSYGEYITMQKKSPTQYEVAFAPESGYLLGETVWHHFNRPLDMIYCEAIPNTNEAILVIVKAGSVYLDGNFPLESIPEELIIFLTQQNNFEIFLYGNVPISQNHVDGKFSFEPQSVKAFTQLEQPVFSTLPLLKIYLLQPVAITLKANGIGVLPLKSLLYTAIFFGALYMLWGYYQDHVAAKEEITPEQASPYWNYNEALMSPSPVEEIQLIAAKMRLMLILPGWQATKLTYTPGSLTVAVKSEGSTTASLKAWAEQHQAKLGLDAQGLNLNFSLQISKRPLPAKIYNLKAVVFSLIDKIAAVYPGNHLQVDEIKNKGVYQETIITIKIEEFSLEMLNLLAVQLADLPIVLQSLSLSSENGFINGTITLQAMGS